MTQESIRKLADYEWEYSIGEEGQAGVLRWKVLISQPTTASHGLSFGIAELPPGAVLKPHHHAPQEIYYITQGRGALLIGNDIEEVNQGSFVCIPENEVHGIKNIGDELLALMWIFPVDNYFDIEYHEDEGGL